MCNETVDIYPSAIQFIPAQYKVHEMCNKAIVACPFDYVPDWYTH